MIGAFYTSPEWRVLRERVKQRDGSRCTVSRLLGGPCSGVLHVHHIEAADERPDLALHDDNCATVCASHHPKWEALRRYLTRTREEAGETRLPPCRHRHPYKSGRIACENERRKKLGLPPLVEEREVALVC